MAKNHIIHTAKRPFGFRDILGYFMGDFGCNMSFHVNFQLYVHFLHTVYRDFIGSLLHHHSDYEDF